MLRGLDELSVCLSAATSRSVYLHCVTRSQAVHWPLLLLPPSSSLSPDPSPLIRLQKHIFRHWWTFQCRTFWRLENVLIYSDFLNDASNCIEFRIMNEHLMCDLLNDSFLLRSEQYYLKYLLRDNDFPFERKWYRFVPFILYWKKWIRKDVKGHHNGFVLFILSDMTNQNH